MVYKLFLAWVVILFSGAVMSQDFSNKGTDFWVAYTGHIDGTGSRMALYITSDQNATGTVDINGSTVNFSVLANQATTVRITNATNPSNSLAYNGQIEGIGAKKGIHITANKPVVVYAHILNAARSGSSLIIPTNTLGKEYYVATYKSNGTNQVRRTEFAVVATVDNTTIEVTPTNADASGIHSANVPFTVNLSKGDVYQYQSNEDLTGSYIKSVATGLQVCKPIAVFSGSTWTAMGCPGGTSGDNLYQQVFPFASWGKTYITAPFQFRAYDIFRILVQDPTTVVTVNGTPLPLSQLVSGRFYEINTQGNNTARVITSDKPICVFQYMITQGCDGVNSDPEMIILNAVEQTLNDITVMSARMDLTPPNTNIFNHYLNIIFKTNTFNSLVIDGAAPKATPIAIAGTNYSYIKEDVSASTLINPAHRITSDSGFICIAYGYGNVESYGYNAGTNVKDLYQFVTLQNQFATVNFPATCVKAPFYFAITLPYKATSLEWNFNNNPNLAPNATITNNAPVPDSSYILDGRTLNVYKIAASFEFNKGGTYPIKVTANNPTPDGCSGIQEIKYDVVVFDPPTADFNFTHSGCLGDSVRFTDASNGKGRPIVKWLWDFGDVTADSLKNPLKKYAIADSFNVRLQSFTDIGCISDTLKPVVISSEPVAKFGVSAPTCIGGVITFTDTSTIAKGTIVKWSWDFGNGNKVVNTSNANVTQTYITPGNYLVTLMVESNSGCRSILFTKTIAVHQNPVVDFSVPNICLPMGAANFNNLSTIADGTVNNLTYNWNFGDNTIATAKNPVHNYTAVGPFNVTLQVTSIYGCIKDTTKVVANIYPQAKAGFTVVPEGCFRDTTVFTDASNGSGSTVVKWNWIFGDGTTDTLRNPKHRYQADGLYSVKLVVVSDKGCLSDTVTKSTMVNALPVAAFSSSLPACETKQVNFTDQSTSKNGTLTNWFWNFGDGSTVSYSNNNPFTKIFNAAGSYPVKLSLVSSKGCKSDTLLKTTVIKPQPVANFIVPEVCLTDAFAQFLDSSYIADNTQSNFTYAWNFGDPNATPLNPNTSTLKNPKHKYTATGNYTVSLTITSVNGCVTNITKAFTINGDIPVSDFSVLSGGSLCSNTTVQIQNASTVNFGSITKIQVVWDVVGAPTVIYTDDNPLPGKIYSHMYPNFQSPASKNFQVRFIAYSGATCVDSKTKQVTINASPMVSFSTMPGICLEAGARQITQASDVALFPGAGFYSGNGVSTNGLFNPSVAKVGTYPIQYLHVLNNGCRDSVTSNITVWPSPVANWGFSSPTCEGSGITFTDSSVANFSKLTQWKWDFADNTVSNLNNNNSFSKTFSVAGTYNVRLQVFTDSGCQSLPVIKPVQVQYLPRVNFSLPVVCLFAGTAQFNSLSSIPDGSQSSFAYNWSFGDQNNTTGSVLRNPVHNYSALGPYNVKLEVTSGFGCKDSLTQQLKTVYPQPNSGYVISTKNVCLGDPFILTGPATSGGGPVAKWEWDYGDGTSSSAANNTKTFTQPGTYPINLFITDQYGCVSGSHVKLATVHPYPVVNAGPDMVVLEGGTATLNPVATGNDLQFKWTPSTYLFNDTSQYPKIMGVADITYKLTVTARGGCATSDQLFIKILKAPTIPNVFSPNGDGINDVWVIQYLESYPGATVDVFNRNGQLLFSTVGYAKPWDGTWKGSPLPVGTYYYIINPKNGRKQMSGSVTILR